VFEVSSNGSGLGATTRVGLEMMTRYATFEVFNTISGKTVSETGVTLPGGHNTRDFIRAVIPVSGSTGYTVPPAPPVVPPPVAGSSTFTNVTAGTRIRYNIRAYNDFIMQTIQPQFFRATISLLADTCSDLDTRDVIFLVPAMPMEVPM